MRAKKRPILYISPLPPPHGGIATWTQKIFKYGLPDGQTFNLIDTKILGSRNIFDTAIVSLTEIWRNLKISWKFGLHLICYRPRLIHLNCSLSPKGVLRDVGYALLAKLFFIPIVIHFHGNIPNFKRNHFYGLSGKALDLLMHIATMMIVINEISLAAIHTQKRRAQKNILLLPNFIEDAIFANKVSKQLTQHYRALFVGGITREKGSIELLLAAQTFPNIEFHLYGKMHADMVKVSWPANVVFHDEVAHSLLLQEMPHYHFLIFPSHQEGFPFAVLEAMSVGLPVIANRVGALPQMIDEGKGGFLCDVSDTQALNQAIEALISQQNQFALMGEYNRHKSFQCYRYSKVIRDLMNLYNQIG